MASPSTPWMKFFPQDWRADEKLRLCSLGARGLWIEMLAIMHRSERYGQLLIGGRVPTDVQLAVQVGAPPDQVTKLLAELEEADVFSRTAGGAIYSRRMTRDQKRAEIARKNGKKGGNPNLGKNKGKSGSLNQQDKPPDKGGDKPQRPEARGQNKPPTPFPGSETGGGKRYEFEGRTIRLNRADYDRWRLAYSAIPDFRAELQALDDWLQGEAVAESKRKNWFQTVSALLGRKHAEWLAKAKEEDAAQASFEARFPPQRLPESEWRALMGDEEFERKRHKLLIAEAPTMRRQVSR